VVFLDSLFPPFTGVGANPLLRDTIERDFGSGRMVNEFNQRWSEPE
jgi:hypothetical protein